MENDFDRHNERLLEIQLIRKRIERIRRELFPTQQRVARTTEQVQTAKRPVERVSKDAELDALKAKLLGRKK